MNSNLTIAHEFDTLYCEGTREFNDGVAIPKKSFDNLWSFILESSNSDVDQIMSVHTLRGRKYIKTGRYIGTIQTRDGHTIEILPKIYQASTHSIADVKVCRKIFLMMLRHFTDRNAKSFQDATLQASENFPILEAYISNYLSELEHILASGLKRGYIRHQSNEPFLKGKLLVGKHIAKNACDKSRFYSESFIYSYDIPQNRIIVTTLKQLLKVSVNSSNRLRIHSALALFEEIPTSHDIEKDIKLSLNSNRLFSSYRKLIEWSEIFLHNKGLTVFSGDNLNQSFLFSAEKLFEDFIAYLFKKYAVNCKTFPQHKKYFLVDKHRGKGIFQLRPDIFVESNDHSINYGCVIVDTKWKNLDSSRLDKQYFIDIKDVYQLYAYGHKYRQGQSRIMNTDVIPQLVLLYPSTEKFSKKLEEFKYDDILNKVGLSLMVVPFDLADVQSYPHQIASIISSLNVKKEQRPVYQYTEDAYVWKVAEDLPTLNNNPLMLVGCYKSPIHLKWILSNNLYNIRFGNRRGAVNKVISAQRLLLYNKDNPKEYKVFTLDPWESRIADYETMLSLGYTSNHKNGEYVLYKIEGELTTHPLYDVIKMRRGNGNYPFFVQY